MNAIRQQKLLRTAAYLAAALGLTLSAPLSAQERPDTDSPNHYAQYPPADQPSGSDSTGTAPDQAQPTTPSQGEEQAQAAPSVDEDVRAFTEFVDSEAPYNPDEELTQKDMDKGIAKYIEDGSKHFSDALATLIPEENKVLKDRHDSWKRRLGKLGDYKKDDYSQQAHDILMESAQLLTAVQLDAYPGQAQGANRLMEIAQNIDPQANIADQQEGFQNYLRQASMVVEEMALSRSGETSALTPQLVPASYPLLAQDTTEQQENQGEDSMFDWVPGVGEDEPKASADKFSTFIQKTENEGISNHGEYVREGVDKMDKAISELIPDDNQVLNDEHKRLSDQRRELDDTEKDNYVEMVRTAFYDRAMLLTAIQQAEFPEHQASVQALRQAAEMLNINEGLASQDAALNAYFSTASDTISSMADSMQDARASAEEYEGAPPVNDSFEEPMMMEDEMAYDEELGRMDEDMAMEDRMMEEQAIEDEMASEDIDKMEMGAEAQRPRTGEMEENIGGGPALTPEVQAYVDFVAMTGEIDMSLQPDRVAVEGMRLLDGALSSFIESGQQDIEDMRVDLTDSIDKLEEDRQDQEAFTSTLNMGLEKSVNLFSGIQQNTFPETLPQVNQVEMASKRFNKDTPVEEQTDALLSFFEASRDAVQAMDTQRRGAQALLIERGLFF
ncbi:hypothetical protein DL240_17505 [Lujinxingia litoralis]|uniref:Uncharacterized protein n=1 Tax=Lujinxingia litoralis TaxID=2211119 RepID=A0A328C3R4_9DELT|nr:hypothetical protein [Lujinxingia litoralis]RAL20377.1 hypothetical protein DL240_17505 [Lujinxingia litoralis]